MPEEVAKLIERDSAEFVKKTAWARLLASRNLQFPTYTEILSKDLLTERRDIVQLFVVADYFDSFRETVGKDLGTDELLYGLDLWLEEHQDKYHESAQKVVALLDEYNTFIQKQSHN